MKYCSTPGTGFQVNDAFPSAVTEAVTWDEATLEHWGAAASAGDAPVTVTNSATRLLITVQRTDGRERT